jgi:hypothetical protein
MSSSNVTTPEDEDVGVEIPLPDDIIQFDAYNRLISKEPKYDHNNDVGIEASYISALRMRKIKGIDIKEQLKVCNPEVVRLIPPERFTVKNKSTQTLLLLSLQGYTYISGEKPGYDENSITHMNYQARILDPEASKTVDIWTHKTIPQRMIIVAGADASFRWKCVSNQIVLPYNVYEIFDCDITDNEAFAVNDHPLGAIFVNTYFREKQLRIIVRRDGGDKIK